MKPTNITRTTLILAVAAMVSSVALQAAPDTNPEFDVAPSPYFDIDPLTDSIIMMHA